MPIRQFEPSRAVEVIAPRYGSGYRIGGRLVLTAAHLLDDVGSDCTERAKQSFGDKTAHSVWKAQDLDTALIELPCEVEKVEAIMLGKLPDINAGEKLAFQMYVYPRWGRTQRDAEKTAAGGRQIEGVIYVADTSPDGLLVLEPERLPPALTTAQSEWEGASGAAIVCDGLVIAVQSQHQNPKRPASLEASPLWIVCDDEQWRQLLEKHSIKPDLEIVRLRDSSPQSPFPAAAFHFSTYRPETWTGREDALSELTQTLQNGSRLLLIHGMTGIGKTTLAERLAAEFAIPETYYGVAFDQGDHSTSFSRGALAILQTLGDDTAHQLPDEQLLPHLLQTLEQHPYWLQLDSVEYLLSQNADGETHFSDPTWLDSFYQFLTQPSNTRIVLTSQALPTDLVNRCLRYDNHWHDLSLIGLERDRWLDLFRNYGVTPQTDEDDQHLCAIADYFEGHPLILKMIAGDIGKRPFNGDVSKYWQEYYSQRQSQLAPKLHQSQEQRARNWVNQTIQSLPELSRQMLQYCSVFRRPVPETFYQAMLPEIPPIETDGALLVLKDRNLLEDHDIQAGQFWLRQHNLIREVAYTILRDDLYAWEVAERQAADLWLNNYEPTSDASNLEQVQGYLEAFYHFYEIGSWIQAEDILFLYPSRSKNIELHGQLFIWNYYQELIPLYEKLIVISKKTNKKSLETIAFSNLGNIFMSLGYYHKAIDYHRRNLTLTKVLGAFEVMGHALGNLGLCYYYLEDLPTAVEFHQKNLALAIRIQDKNGEMAALGNLGLTYHTQGNYEEAADYYRKCLIFYSEVSDYWKKAVTLANFGHVLFKLQKYSASLKVLKDSVQVSRAIGDRETESQAFKNLAELYKSLGNINKARQYCQQAFMLATELSIPLKDDCQKLMEDLESG